MKRYASWMHHKNEWKTTRIFIQNIYFGSQGWYQSGNGFEKDQSTSAETAAFFTSTAGGPSSNQGTKHFYSFGIREEDPSQPAGHRSREGLTSGQTPVKLWGFWVCWTQQHISAKRMRWGQEEIKKILVGGGYSWWTSCWCLHLIDTPILDIQLLRSVLVKFHRFVPVLKDFTPNRDDIFFQSSWPKSSELRSCSWGILYIVLFQSKKRFLIQEKLFSYTTYVFLSCFLIMRLKSACNL